MNNSAYEFSAIQKKPRLPLIASFVAALLQAFMPFLASAAPLEFPTRPLVTSSGSAHPNLMFMLDDSASMAWDYLPDNIHNTYSNITYSSSKFSGEIASCFDTTDVNFGASGTILDSPLPCVAGDPPFMSPQVNQIYYNPEVRYTPPVQANGTSFGDQTPTTVQTDPFGQQQTNQLGQSVTTVDITTQYPDRVWCADDNDPTSTCFKNGSASLSTTAYVYPDSLHGKGLNGVSFGSSSGQSKYAFGSPYYYELLPARYCDNEDLKDTVGGTSGHCSATAGGAFIHAATVQWCKYDYSATAGSTIDYSLVKLNDCQATRRDDYQYPRYLGTVSASVPGKAPYAVITFPTNPSSYESVNGVYVGSGTTSIMGSSALTGYTSNAALASALAASINSQQAASGKWEFVACAGNGTSGTGCDQFPFNYHLVNASGTGISASAAANSVYVFPAAPNGVWTGPSSTTQPYGITSGSYPPIHEDVSVSTGTNDTLVVQGPTTTSPNATATLTICPGTTCNSFLTADKPIITSIRETTTNTELLAASVQPASAIILNNAADQNVLAKAIATAIVSNSGVSGFTVVPTPPTGNTVTIQRVATGPFTGGFNITASGVLAGSFTYPSAIFDTSSAGLSLTTTANQPVAITDLKVDGVALITGASPVWASGGLPTATEKAALASALCTALGSPSGFAVTCPGNTAPNGVTATSTQVIISGSASHNTPFTASNTVATVWKNWQTITVPLTLPLPYGVTSVKPAISNLLATKSWVSTETLSSAPVVAAQVAGINSPKVGTSTTANRDTFGDYLATYITAGGASAIRTGSPGLVTIKSTSNYLRDTTPSVSAQFFTAQLTAPSTTNGAVTIPSIPITFVSDATIYEALNSTPLTITSGQTSSQAADTIIGALKTSGSPKFAGLKTCNLAVPPVCTVYIYEDATTPRQIVNIGNGSTLTITSTSSWGTITASNAPSFPATAPAGPPNLTKITAIYDGTTNILGSNTINIAAGASANTIASDIKSAISAAGYTATVSGAVVTITRTSGTMTSLTPVLATTYRKLTFTAAPPDKPVVVSGVTVTTVAPPATSGGAISGNLLSSSLYFAPGTTAASIASAVASNLGTSYAISYTAGSSDVYISSDTSNVTAATVTYSTPVATLTTSATSASMKAYLSSIKINGVTEVFTGGTRVISAGSSASSVASTIAGAIGNGYSASASGNVVTIYGTTAAAATGITTSNPTVTLRYPYSATINVGNWQSGTGSVSSLQINGSLVGTGSFSDTTPAGLASQIAGAIGTTATGANYFASYTGGNNYVTVFSPDSASAPPTITFNSVPPSNVTGVHPTASASVAGGEVNFSSSVTKSVMIGGTCSAAGSLASANLITGDTAPTTATTPFLNAILAKDASDAFTLSANSGTLTVTENTSGTYYAGLNGCSLQFNVVPQNYSSKPIITTVAFSGGVTPNTSTAGSATAFTANGSPSVSGGTSAGSGSINGSNTTRASFLSSYVNPSTTTAAAVAGGVTFSATAAPGASTWNATLNGNTSATGYISASAFSTVSGTVSNNVAGFTNSSVGQLATRSNVGNFQRVDLVPATCPSATAQCYCPTTDSACYGRNLSTNTKYGDRSDCAASTGCTYAEELQNFANWYAYYRTRMQAMKTGVGIAFNPIGGAYRVGFMTIHPDNSIVQTGYSNVPTAYVPLADFLNNTSSTQKTSWYSALYGTTPATQGDLGVNSSGSVVFDYTQTPLRAALSTAGQLFAGKKPLQNRTDNGGDPMQYSCQANFVLLTTDGYWNEDNEAAVLQPDGSTQIGDQDNTKGAPYFDGDRGADSSCPLGAGNSLCLGGNSTTFSATSAPYVYRSFNTLADVAYFYANTDLRNPLAGWSPPCTGAQVTLPGATASSATFDVCTDTYNNVTHAYVPQTMKTYAVGFGVDGLLKYKDGYTTNSADYMAIAAGTKAWPQVKNNDPTGSDDLWHAAVNGGGQYFSAKTPASLKNGIINALNNIDAKVGASTGIALQSQNITSTTNLAFQPSYVTVQWYGNLQAITLSPSTGLPSSGTSSNSTVWCLSDLFDPSNPNITTCHGTLAAQFGATASGRTVYMGDYGTTPASNKLKSFDFSLMSSAEKAYFTPSTSIGAGQYLLDQYVRFNSTQQSNATGGRLVDYLRGDRSYEMSASTSNNQLFRTRPVSVLGDVVNSKPVYVSAPFFSYADPGYARFSADPLGTGTTSTRSPTVYFGANDGMLHAVNATTGTTGASGYERWAFVPQQVLPKMHRLANANYAKADDPTSDDVNNHQSYVDGPIAIADACFSNCTIPSSAEWRTVLIGGLGYGGRGYYALDVTNPASPKLLWEFTTSTDSDVGFATGPAVVTKDGSGRWVALLASGYNNSDGTTSTANGDGQGHLYVVDVTNGTVISKLDTGAGTPATPSGFAKFAAWVDSANTNNTTQHVYGGDLLGNLWRFDIDAGTVVKLAELTDGTTTNKPQPITTRPELGLYQNRIILVGTGKFIEPSDATNSDVQTIYGIFDRLSTSTTALTNPHATSSTMVQQTLTMVDSSGAATTNLSLAVGRNVSTNPVNPATNAGWYIDLPELGERVNVNPILAGGLLNVASVVPYADGCAPGHSWYTFVDYRTGGPSGGGLLSTQASVPYKSTVIVDVVIVNLASGIKPLLIDSETGIQAGTGVSSSPTGGLVAGHRSGWREVVE